MNGRMSGKRQTVILTTVGVAVIMLVIGVALGSIAFPLTKTQTTTRETTETANLTITQVNVVGQSYPTTVVATAQVETAETVIENVVVKSGEIGGGIACEGNLSAN